MPDYDSGWLNWQSEQILNHNLGTKELFVHVMYKNSEGLVQTCTRLVHWWSLDEQSIMVQSSKVSVGDEFRIVIWKLGDPANFLFGINNPM
jgi:urease accessory protein UreF